MSKKQQYLVCLAAYFSGWCFAQPLYNRLRKRAVHREMANPSIETKAWFQCQAVALADELESRRVSDRVHA